MNEQKTVIGIVTGTRADYGILRPVIQALAGHQSLSPTLIVAGMHLLPDFGSTVQDIEHDGYHIGARVDMLLGGDSPAAMAKSLGLGIISMTQAIGDAGLGLVVVLGDRGEAFSAAVAAAHLNIPVAHLHGGECTTGGNIDEAIRWSISRFAHIHLVATENSAMRLIASGENRARVHLVGAPSLDAALSQPPMPQTELAHRLGIDLERPTIVVIQHPVTTESHLAADQMKETMEAAVGQECQVIVIYPNADAGGKAVIRVIEEYRGRPGLSIHLSLPHATYLNLLRHASVLVGNSSSALIEAPSFGLPAINVGIRQAGRDRGQNIIDVSHDRHAIAAAIRQVLSDPGRRSFLASQPNPYGDGTASSRIAAVLAQAVADPHLLQKGTFQSQSQDQAAGGVSR